MRIGGKNHPFILSSCHLVILSPIIGVPQQYLGLSADPAQAKLGGMNRIRYRVPLMSARAGRHMIEATKRSCQYHTGGTYAPVISYIGDRDQGADRGYRAGDRAAPADAANLRV